ncbi:DUF4157 domain-containing protein [Streptomyces sp. NPDC047017]|uniref:eCIS core domain-containing protein n=1 Tax=Streptomyces sp. NPDC047017 TaxID=3155024 RepID=UPI0033E74ED3
MRAHENQDAQQTGAQVKRGSVPAPNAAAGRLLNLQRLAGNAAVSRAVEEERHAHGPGCGHPETAPAGGQAAVQRRVSLGEAHGPGCEHPETPAGGQAAVQRRVSLGEALASPGTPLEPRIRNKAKQAYGMSFDHVLMHSGPVAQRSAAELGALAYTTGSDIVSQEPNLDDETLFHEVDHVYQQAMGPVAGTSNGAGANVSSENDAFERSSAANGRRLSQGQAPDLTLPGDAGHSASVQRAPAAAHGPAVAVQRKGHEKLKEQIKPQQSTGGSLMSWIKKPDPQSRVTAPVRDAIQAYDDSPQRDPNHCMGQLADIQQQAYILMEEAQKAAERAYLEEALRVIRAEMEVLGGQVDRDQQMPAAARTPYKDMTDRGTLWKDPEFRNGTLNLGMEGASYVRELSEMNRADQRREIGGRSEDAWVRGVRAKLSNALEQSVVAHYTPRARFDAIEKSADKSLKSKTELDRQSVGDKHNTMNVDTYMLANDGFVFFYIEPAGLKGRKSRFGEGKEGEGEGKARIELGLAESGLLTRGWIMLSDFVQRDYPDILTAKDKPDQVTGSAQSDGASEVSRKFERGMLSEDQLMESLTAFGHIENTEERQAHQLARQYAHMDPGSHMSYGPGNQLQRPELLHNNILAGPDILPGLVDRVVVEIMRFEQTNPALAKSLKEMSGADLMNFLLRHLIKNQAMIPNTVDISKAKVTAEEGP